MPANQGHGAAVSTFDRSRKGPLMSNDIQIPVDPTRPLPPVPPLQVAISALDNIAQEATRAATTLRQVPVNVPPVGPPGVPPVASTAGVARPAAVLVAAPPVAPAAPTPPAPLSADAAGLLALSGVIESRLGSDSALQSMLQNLVSEAASSQARSMNVVPLMRPGGTGGSITTGNGSGSSGGSGAPQPPPPTVKLPPFPTSTFWWGFHMFIPEDGVRIIEASLGIEGAGLGVGSTVAGAAVEGGILSALAAAGASGPLAIFLAALAAFVVAQAALIQAVDKGKGVYVNMSWFAPGVFVPTSA